MYLELSMRCPMLYHNNQFFDEQLCGLDKKSRRTLLLPLNSGFHQLQAASEA